MIGEAEFKRYDFEERSEKEVLENAGAFADCVARRRSIRQFSTKPVKAEIVENIIRAAGAAPSGANMQPWEFDIIGDPTVKTRIRQAAERRERKFYDQIASDDFLQALLPLGTGPRKQFLEDAPWLIVVFALQHGQDRRGDPVRHYYVEKSVGIAVGFLLAAVHQAGLCALVYTPPSITFLNRILDRPKHHKPFAIIPVGYPAPGCQVPDIQRKPLDRISRFI